MSKLPLLHPCVCLFGRPLCMSRHGSIAGRAMSVVVQSVVGVAGSEDAMAMWFDGNLEGGGLSS
jgi:hypothetical protein